MTECYAYAHIRRRTAAAAARESALSASTRGRARNAGSAVASLTLHSHSSGPQLLPAWEYLAGGTRGRQFAWDGRRLRLVDQHTFCSNGARDSGRAFSADALGRMLRRAQSRLCGAFLPDVESVTSDYWDYARWRFVQRVAAQALAVLGTQQMLLAVGLGASKRVADTGQLGGYN